MNNISLPLKYCHKVGHVGQCAMPPYSTIPVSNNVVKLSISYNIYIIRCLNKYYEILDYYVKILVIFDEV